MHRFKNAMLGRSAFFFFANISFVKTLVCLRSEEKFTLQSMLVYSSQKISNHGQLSKNSISAIINHRAAIFSAKWLIIWAIWIRTLSGLITFKTAEKPQQIVVVRSMTWLPNRVESLLRDTCTSDYNWRGLKGFWDTKPLIQETSFSLGYLAACCMLLHGCEASELQS